MIVTLTCNTAIDNTLIVSSWKFGGAIRATQSSISMGGKPADVSYVLGALGVPSLAMGFTAGLNGQRMEAMLVQRGATPRFVQANGETRLNTVIIVEDTHQEVTITTPALEVTGAQLDELRRLVSQALDQADVIALGGSLPRGVPLDFYPEVIGMAKAKGVPAVVDASGAPLLAALPAGPLLIKPNRVEMEEISGHEIVSVEDARHAAAELQARYGCHVVVSLGKDGAVAVLGDQVYRAYPPPVKVVSPAGSGDALMAGMVLSIARHEPLLEGLRLGMAAAAAVVMMAGTADCRKEDVDRLLPQVRIEEWK
jgi:1-phosphofructokinase family hexose kinase